MIKLAAIEECLIPFLTLNDILLARGGDVRRLRASVAIFDISIRGNKGTKAYVRTLKAVN